MNAASKEKVFIYGASGHAKVVLDIIEQQDIAEVVFIVDDNPVLKNNSFFGYPVIGGKDELLLLTGKKHKGIIAIGSNKARTSISIWLLNNGYELAKAIHPSAQLGRGVSVGGVSVIMANAVINSDSSIGNNVIINTRASVDHDCQIGNNVHIAPGATLCGGVSVGDGSFVAAGATIIPNLNIGRNVIVGAGAVVIKDIPDDVTVVGNPARILAR